MAGAVDLFRTNYLEVVHNGAATVTYPYTWSGHLVRPCEHRGRQRAWAGRADKGQGPLRFGY